MLFPAVERAPSPGATPADDSLRGPLKWIIADFRALWMRMTMPASCAGSFDMLIVVAATFA